MATLIVKKKGGAPQRFEVTGKTTLIGRGKDTDLLLPDISVSRHHARVDVEKKQYIVVDLDSQNGLIHNGVKTKRAHIKDGDTIQIGKFLLTFEKKEQTDAKTKASKLDSYTIDAREGFLNRVSQLDGDGAHGTAVITPEMIAKVRAAAKTINSACIVSLDNKSDSWPVGELPLAFGRDIPVKGLGLGGKVSIYWADKCHVIEKKAGLFTSLSVNGLKVTKAKLKNGDSITVGKSLYRYQV